MFPNRFVWFLAALLLSAGAAQALDSTDLTFYAPFDGSLDAVFAAGDAKPQKVTGQYGFVPGVLGKAVLAGEPDKELAYGVDGNFPDRKGTISLWFKLSDWGTTSSHLILSIPKRLLLRQAPNSGGIHLEWPNIGGNTYSYLPYLSKDKFIHMVYTWGDGNVTLYGNGAYSRHVSMSLPPFFPSGFKELSQWTKGLQFFVSDPSMSPDGKNRTIIDELMLFNRSLNATEVRDLYRHFTVSLPETIAAIGEIASPPKIDGVFSPVEWSRTAQMADFVDRPFGNLSPRVVKSNIGYDQKALYLSLRSPEGNTKTPRENNLEIRLFIKDAKEPIRFVVTADRELSVYRGSSAVQEEMPWQAAVSALTGTETAESCFEVAIPWTSVGLSAPPEGTSLKLNILRRFSAAYGDFASWVEVSPDDSFTDPARCGTIILSGRSPVLAIDSLGKLNYAQLELAGRILNSSGKNRNLNAEVRLQPSDLKEYYDPKTLPGTKSYTGAQLVFDRTVSVQGESVGLRVTSSFSDTDINSLWLKVSDPDGKIIYQAQRTFVAQPPVTVTTKTFPDHDRLEVTADISCYRESPPQTLRAEIELTSPSGKVVGTARIDKFSSTSATVNLSLASLPTGTIKVNTTLWKGKTKISLFTTSFDRLAPGPWLNNKLGKDDIVIPPFTPVKVVGQNVSVWGRTYKWDNSLFPVQITSSGEDMLAGPMELVVGGAAAGKPNSAVVRIREQKDTRAVVECTGTIGGVPVVAEHTIEYDGMCLTRLKINPSGETQLPGLVLRMPYKREQSSLYMLWPMAGSVTEKVNYDGPPMNGKRTLPFQNFVWLGNEDRGMVWFAESPAGWKLKGNSPPLTVEAEAGATSLTVRFAEKPFAVAQSLSLTFGIVATPVKPMPDNWRTMRLGRTWLYAWCGGFTVSNNDIANPSSLFTPGNAKQRMVCTKFQPYYDSCKPLSYIVPYQRPDWIHLKQPEATYYGEEWLIPPRSTSGSDTGSSDRHLGVCLNSKWQDFMLYYAVKAYNDLSLDGYYFDGAAPASCGNALHGCGWIDEDGNVQPSWNILADREFFKRLAVERSKAGKPSFVFGNLNGGVVIPTFSFMDMAWNGEQFSMDAGPAKDYNKLLTLPYFRVHFLGQQFGVWMQWLTFGSESQALVDSVLELSLVHGVGDLCGVNNPYTRGVLNAQDDFGIGRKDARFLPYWKNSKQVTVEPADENLVCSIWQRPGKVLLVLANSTKDDQTAKIRLNPSVLGLAGSLKASDLINKESQIVIEAGTVTAKVAHANWRLIVVEGARVGVEAVEQPADFFLAVQKGDLAKVKEFLSADGRLIKAKDWEGYTALHFAAFNDRKDVAAYLLEKGADVNARCRFGFTPLHLAASDCYKDVVELLIAKGADVNARENNGITPLHFAVNVPLVNRVPSNYIETATLLIEKGAGINGRDGFGRTPLHWVVGWHWSYAEPKMAELLVAKGADVNARDRKKWTPLGCALNQGGGPHPELIAALRKLGGVE